MVKRKKGAIWQTQLRAFFLLLGLIVVGSLTFRGINVVKNSLFDGTHRLTIVIDSKEVSLFTLEPKSKRSAFILFPKNTSSPAPQGEGEYQLSKVFELGALDNKGGPLLMKSIELLMGVPVDGWMVNKGQSEKCQDAGIFFSINCLPFLLRSGFSGNLDTNLTVLDIIRIMLILQSLRPEEKARVEALRYVQYDEEELFDGTRILRLKRSDLDKLAREHFLDSRFLEERLGVAIVNGTNVSGLGNEFARILTNAGVNVVSVSTAKGEIEYSSIEVTDSQKTSYTVKRLQKIFGFSTKTTRLITEDIRINLGGDYYSSFSTWDSSSKSS